MQRTIITLALLVVLWSPLPARALAQGYQPTDFKRNGNLILDVCAPFVRAIDGHPLSTDALESAAYCPTLLRQLHTQVQASPALAVCLPSSAVVGHIARLLVQLLQRHPEVLHTEAHIVYSGTLTMTFPCRHP